MASTNFIDYSNATPITAAWLNDVNRTQYTILGNPADRSGLVALDTATATGTSDALIGTFSVTLSTIPDGIVYRLKAIAANTTTTPTFTPNSGVVTPAIIVKGNGSPLVAGDIGGAGYWATLQWSATLAKWVLMNPATGTAYVGDIIRTIGASVASNALTLTLSPTYLDFRNSTLTSGIPNIRNIPTTLSLVVPNTATLGCLSSSAQYTTDRLMLLAVDNAGTVDLAVVNLTGGNNLDETTLINTTAISATATSPNVIYSNASYTNVPFRVVGQIVLPAQTVAGTWATGPSLVQGQGGQAFAAMASVGFGQTLAANSKSQGVTYYNTKGKPVTHMIALFASGVAVTANITIAGVSTLFTITANTTSYAFFMVSPGESYSVSGASAINGWNERS